MAILTCSSVFISDAAERLLLVADNVIAIIFTASYDRSLVASCLKRWTSVSQQIDDMLSSGWHERNITVLRIADLKLK